MRATRSSMLTVVLVTLAGCGRLDGGGDVPPSAASPDPDPSPAPAPSPTHATKRGLGQIALSSTDSTASLSAWFTDDTPSTTLPRDCSVESLEEHMRAPGPEVGAGDIHLMIGMQSNPIASLWWDPARSTYDRRDASFQRAGFLTLGPLVIRGSGGVVPGFRVAIRPIRSLAIAPSTAAAVVDGGDLEVAWQTDEDDDAWVELATTTTVVASCRAQGSRRSVTIPASLVAQVLTAGIEAGHPAKCTACARVTVYLHRTTTTTSGDYDVALTHVYTSQVGLAVDPK